MTAAAGLDGGLLVAGDDVLVLAQRDTLEPAGVQVQNTLGLDAEVRVADEDPGPVLPGLERILAQPAAHRGRGDGLGDPARGQLGGQLRARPARQRHAGLGGQLAGQRFGLGYLHGGEPGGAPGALAVGQGRQPRRGRTARARSGPCPRAGASRRRSWHYSGHVPQGGRLRHAAGLDVESCARKPSSSAGGARRQSASPPRQRARMATYLSPGSCGRLISLNNFDCPRSSCRLDGSSRRQEERQ